MIQFVRGNLLKADVDALVNTVNTVGIMGKGIALQFKQMFPHNYIAYKKACIANNVKPGKMFVYSTGLIRPRYIINFPTKRHWKDKSKIEDIESGLKSLVDVVLDLKICSIAIPPLGCGNGGLNWNDVKPRIEAVFRNVHNVSVLVFEPFS